MYDARTNLSADVAGEARRHLGGSVYDTVIPRSVRLSEAPSHGLPITRYAPEFARRDRLCTPSPSNSERDQAANPRRRRPTDAETRDAAMVMS